MATHGPLRPSPAALIVAMLAALAALVFTACTGDNSGDGDDDTSGAGPTIARPNPEGEPRHTMLGFSSLPPERTTQAYIAAIATAAQYGDILLIHRTPPWEDFLPGSDISGQTADLTRLETRLLDQYDHLKLVFAIDPTDAAVQRTRIADLPAQFDPQEGFRNPSVRQAFIAYTAYVVKNYHPDYLVLGVEVNMLRDRSPDQYEAFLSLYKEAFAVAREANPATKIFPAFQLEDLEGLLDRRHEPQWDVLEDFRGWMDVLAVTTYPYLTGVRSAAEIRHDYYSQLSERFTGEVMILEAGYASAPVPGQPNLGTERDQQQFLERLLADAEANGFSAVIWFAALDPLFVTQGPAAVLKDIGLRKSDGANKLAWETWETWARRPLE